MPWKIIKEDERKKNDLIICGICLWLLVETQQSFYYYRDTVIISKWNLPHGSFIDKIRNKDT